MEVTVYLRLAQVNITTIFLLTHYTNEYTDIVYVSARCLTFQTLVPSVFIKHTATKSCFFQGTYVRIFTVML